MKKQTNKQNKIVSIKLIAGTHGNTGGFFTEKTYANGKVVNSRMKLGGVSLPAWCVDENITDQGGCAYGVYYVYTRFALVTVKDQNTAYVNPNARGWGKLKKLIQKTEREASALDHHAAHYLTKSGEYYGVTYERGAGSLGFADILAAQEGYRVLRASDGEDITTYLY